ncbi:MAG: serine hydrolase domain-containing protein, partial [Stenotrophomonas sp.]
MQFRHDVRLLRQRATCFLGTLALCMGPALSAEEASMAPEARVARVEAGLSTPVMVKGAVGGKMDLQQRMAFHNVPAVSIALIDQGRVQWARAYGVTSADGENAASVTPDTLFQAASVSKAVSAVGALVLLQQRRLSLDAPANDQLTAWKIPDNDFTRAKPVSLRMLLNHSAGMTVHGYLG